MVEVCIYKQKKNGKQRIITLFHSCVNSSETNDWENYPDDVSSSLEAAHFKKKKKKACVSDPRCNILGAVRFCTTAVNTPGFNSGQKTAWCQRQTVTTHPEIDKMNKMTVVLAKLQNKLVALPVNSLRISVSSCPVHYLGMDSQPQLNVVYSQGAYSTWTLTTSSSLK